MPDPNKVTGSRFEREARVNARASFDGSSHPRKVCQYCCAHQSTYQPQCRNTRRNLCREHKQKNEHRTIRTTAPKSIQGEHSFYHHSHGNLTQLPTCIATRNDRITSARGFLGARTLESTEKTEGEDNYNNRSHGSAMQLPIIATQSPATISKHGQKKNGNQSNENTYEEKTTITVAASNASAEPLLCVYIYIYIYI